jgi:phosphoglycerol transferase MdoB-like AlkP superfamily enzyme
MTTNAVLLVILSLLVAGGLSFFSIYIGQNKSKLIFWLFYDLYLFCVLLLLINPVISRNSIEIIKPVLSVVVDNSSSIVTLNADKTAVETYPYSQNTLDKFDVQSYQFDSEFLESDKFDFKGKQTNLIATNLKRTIE